MFLSHAFQSSVPFQQSYNPRQNTITRSEIRKDIRGIAINPGHLFTYEDNQYVLRQTIAVTLNEDGLYTIEIPSLEMYTYGENFSELIENLSEEIDFLFEFYMTKSDSELDASAIPLKSELPIYFSKV